MRSDKERNRLADLAYQKYRDRFNSLPLEVRKASGPDVFTRLSEVEIMLREARSLVKTLEDRKRHLQETAIHSELTIQDCKQFSDSI